MNISSETIEALCRHLTAATEYAKTGYSIHCCIEIEKAEQLLSSPTTSTETEYRLEIERLRKAVQGVLDNPTAYKANHAACKAAIARSKA